MEPGFAFLAVSIFRLVKDAYQRALMADRDAIVERAEIFVHELQCDLERGAAALGSMPTILADVTRRCTFQSSSVSLSSAIVHTMAPSLGKAQLRHPHQNVIEVFHHRMLDLSPKYNIPCWQTFV
jgi:hypothetical protein